MKNFYKIIFVVPFLFLITGCFETSKTEEPTETEKVPMTEKSTEKPLASLVGMTAKLYRSPTCGCCTGHADAMKAAGIDVEIISDNLKLDAKKAEYKIARNLQSCHTIEMAGYFIEGHVPLEAMAKLITEKPEIDGIALPGMPIGTPGMPGVKTEPYEVRQIKNGESSEFMTL